MDAFSQSATYTWWQEMTPETVRASHRWVADYARKHGPYDAVCGFSQGCSVTGSMALYHAFDSAGGKEDLEPLPFRAAIFLCGGIPLPALSDMGMEVTPRAQGISDSTMRLLEETQAMVPKLVANPSRLPRGTGLWDINESKLLHDADDRPPREDVFGLDYTAFPKAVRIAMPTVHIYGAKDPRWPACIQLAEFCDDKKEWGHRGGHEVPRVASDRIAAMVLEVMNRIK